MKKRVDWLNAIFTGALIFAMPACSAGANPQIDTEAMPIVESGSTNVIQHSNTGSQVASLIDYGNCTHLYAVQTGDTLTEIASISATTVDFVMAKNGLDENTDIYPGLVLCLETGETGV